MNNLLQITSLNSKLSLPEVMRQKLEDCRSATIATEVCHTSTLNNLQHSTKEVFVNGILELGFVNRETKKGNMIQPFAGRFLFTCTKEVAGAFESVWCTSLS